MEKVKFFNLDGVLCWVNNNAAFIEAPLELFAKESNGSGLRIGLHRGGHEYPYGVGRFSYGDRGTIGHKDISFGWIEFNSKELASFNIVDGFVQLEFYLGTKNYHRVSKLNGIEQPKTKRIAV